MTALLLDTSVLVKWFHSAGEGDVSAARIIRDAHANDRLDVHVLDLAVYELGNVLLRGLHWDGPATAAQLEDMATALGPPLPLPRAAWPLAADLAARYRLTFYDAAWAAGARTYDVALVSADKMLLAAALAESPEQTVERLRL